MGKEEAMSGLCKREPKMLPKVREWLKEHPKSTIKQVAEGVGCDPSYVWQLSRDYDLNVRRNRHIHLTDDERKEVVGLWKAKWKTRDIADYFMISQATVRRVCRGISGFTHHWTEKEDLLLMEMMVAKVGMPEIRKRLGGLTRTQVQSHREYLKWQHYNASYEEILVKMLEKKYTNIRKRDNSKKK